jgi:hypothetical protein
MGIIDRLFPAPAAATSAAIQNAIAKAESEAAALRTKLSAARTGIAFMSDAEHQSAEQDIAATERAIKRLEARVIHLTEELPAVVEAETAAAAAEADATLIRRAKAATKANTVEAKKLLEQYAEHASEIADIIAKLQAISGETDSVNAALRSNPVTEQITGWNPTHRKAPDQIATEQRAMVPHWIYRDAPRQPGEVNPGDTEEAVRCSLDSAGKPLHPAGVRYGRFNQVIAPVLEHRSVTVTRQAFRPGRAEPSLNEVRLPPAFTGAWHWPRG